MSRLDKVSKLANLLRGVTITVMVFLPVTIVGMLLTTPLVPASLSPALGGVRVSPDATTAQMIGIVTLSLISPLILLLTLNQMRKLFGSYAEGEVLTDASAICIQRIGRGFVALAVAPFFYKPVQILLATWSNPPGERAFAIGFDSQMITFALAGGLIIVIGWAMREASDVASENKSFV